MKISINTGYHLGMEAVILIIVKILNYVHKTIQSKTMPLHCVTFSDLYTSLNMKRFLHNTRDMKCVSPCHIV